MDSESSSCCHFEFLDIQKATHYFDESLVIGRGGFGKVYRATISNGSTLVDAAIKRLDSLSNQGAAEFWAEVETVSKLRHCNLVSLIGYCTHEKELILVYEYMPNGTLADHLHRLGTSLSWLRRLKICIGAARGLEYLHTGTGIDVGVIHRDIKTSNILLHETWAAKISDFGLSISGPTNHPSSYVSTVVKGTLGYLDPDYYESGRLTRKSDVYAFGVVLLEVLCGRRAVDTSLDEQQQNLARWAQESIIQGNIKHIVDSDIKGQISFVCLKEFARVANRCLQRKSTQRPTMAEVVAVLDSVLTLQQNVNNSSQPGCETIYDGMLDMLSFPSDDDDNIGSQPCRHFEFPEIQQATNDFDESLVIGHGGFGTVYRGDVMMGSSLVIAAIKRLDSTSSQGAAEFWAEVQILSKLRHCNLVSLIGYCNYEKEMILMYEYMSNGTLEDHLHRHGTPLSWLQRLKICVGAGRGLHYLHTGTGIEVGVIHRDVKTSNILLHESWAAKISDFGLSKTGPTDQPSTYVNTVVRGTFGYLDPDYSFTGKLTRKSDVYAFGVVLLEVLCGRPALDRSLDDDKQNLARWAQESIKEGNLRHIIDSDIRGQISQKCLKEFVLITERCLHSNRKKRPTMAEVVGSLESVLTLQERISNSMQTADKRIFGRMLDMLAFPSIGDNSAKGNSKPSSNTKGKSRIVGNMFVGTGELPAEYKVPSSKEFKFRDLKRATSNFSSDQLIGRGGYGHMFVGWVDKNTFTPSTRGDGIAVAVRRYITFASKGAYQEWLAEMDILGHLTHPNIISLLGYSNDKKDEYLLVYEYMQNKSLHSHLHPDIGAEPLSWGTRLRIMIGVARGLSFLHSSNVIHRDVKRHNILLDQDFNAKLSDFGLARFGPEIGETHVSTRVAGTLGYLDPYYCIRGKLSVKSDVYSFGVVLLETLTGLKVQDMLETLPDLEVMDMDRPDDSDEQWSLAVRLSRILAHREELKNIIDPCLEKNYPEEGVFKYAKLALRCIAGKPEGRPSSEEVLSTLEQIYAVSK